MSRAPLLLVAVLLLTAPTGVRGQGQSEPQGQGNVRTLITPAALVFPTPGVAEFSAGYVDSEPVRVDIQSRPVRFPWELLMRAEEPDMGGYGKPISDILWRPDGAMTWEPLSTLDRLVAAGVGDDVLLLHFRMRLDWAYDEPGDYAVALTFTAIRP